MPPTALRRPVALASAVTIGAATVLGGVTAANANLPSEPGYLLTSSNASGSVLFSNRTRLDVVGESIKEISWAPDGSRGVYIDAENRIKTVRYNDNSEVWTLVEFPKETGDPGPRNAVRNDPIYTADGTVVYWAETSTLTGISQIKGTYAICCYESVVVSPEDGANYSEPDIDYLGHLVVQRKDGDDPSEVGYLASDGYHPLIPDAASPSISPDGTKIAFIRAAQLFTANIDGSDVVQVTSNGGTKMNPTWSPDGTTLAFNQGNIAVVVTAPANGSAAPTQVDFLNGIPAYQSRHKDRVYRVAGTDRFTTGAAISQTRWANANDSTDDRTPAKAVVLSRSDTFADALGGSALSAKVEGPLLLTTPTGLSPATQTEIQRILAPGRDVYLLGSPGAISETVANQLRALGYNPRRLAGQDRFTTSLAIANFIDPTPDKVLVATGMNFPDALAAGAAAGSFNVPGTGQHAVVVLTNDDKASPEVANYLAALPPSTDKYGIGLQGYNASSDYGSWPVYGSSRFETSVATAWAFFGPSITVGLATGMDWPDALSGGALMGNLGGPLLLTNGTAAALDPYVGVAVREVSPSITMGLVFGSAPVINSAQLTGLGTLLSGPAGYSSLLPKTSAIGVAATGAKIGPMPPLKKQIPTHGAHPAPGLMMQK